MWKNVIIAQGVATISLIEVAQVVMGMVLSK
jgi:hypothetical protein